MVVMRPLLKISPLVFTKLEDTCGCRRGAFCHNACCRKWVALTRDSELPKWVGLRDVE